VILRREVVALLGRAAVCAWPLAARAAMQELGRNDGSVYVYFFGGYRSTISDVDAWGKSLEAKVSGTTAIVFPIRPAHRSVIRWQGGAIRRMLLCTSWREGTSPA